MRLFGIQVHIHYDLDEDEAWLISGNRVERVKTE